jgi:membrane-associated phospholipid phosphatase
MSLSGSDKKGEFMNYKRLGDFLTLAIPCTTLCMIAGYFPRDEMKKFIFAYLLVSFITWLMKASFFAPRPNANIGDSVRWKWSVNDGDTFPSGHTSSAMAGAVYALFIYYPVGIPLIALAILCAWTRVQVKAHFYRDVFFGSVVAQLGCGLVYWDFFKLDRWL